MARKLVVRDGLVTVRDLAEAIGLDRSCLFRALKRQGIALEKRRSLDAGGQLVSVMAVAEAERFLAARRAESLGPRGEVAYLAIE